VAAAVLYESLSGTENDTFADLDCLTATNSIPVWDETTSAATTTETESGSLSSQASC